MKKKLVFTYVHCPFESEGPVCLTFGWHLVPDTHISLHVCHWFLQHYGWRTQHVDGCRHNTLPLVRHKINIVIMRCRPCNHYDPRESIPNAETPLPRNDLGAQECSTCGRDLSSSSPKQSMSCRASVEANHETNLICRYTESATSSLQIDAAAEPAVQCSFEVLHLVSKSSEFLFEL
jgi:hypothetical protein